MLPHFLFDWADKASDDPNRTFSGAVVARFFVGLILLSVPVLTFKFMMIEADREKERQAEQEKLDAWENYVRQKVAAGEAGEAFQRLYGKQPAAKKDDPPQKKSLSDEDRDALQQLLKNGPRPAAE